MRSATNRRILTIVAVWAAAAALLFGLAFRSAATLEVDSVLLLIAIRAAVASAVITSAAGVALAVRGFGRGAVALLLALTGFTGLVAAVLEQVGSVVANLDRGSRPDAVNALFDTVTGAGAALDPVPCILAVGAVVALLGALFRTRGRRVIAVFSN